MNTKKICNVCGKELDIWDEQQGLTIERKLSYGSIYDGKNISLHFCCGCMDELIGACAVSPVEQEDSDQIKMEEALGQAYGKALTEGASENVKAIFGF